MNRDEFLNKEVTVAIGDTEEITGICVEIDTIGLTVEVEGEGAYFYPWTSVDHVFAE